MLTSAKISKQNGDTKLELGYLNLSARTPEPLFEGSPSCLIDLMHNDVTRLDAREECGS
jgi:hypothetical protein